MIIINFEMIFYSILGFIVGLSIPLFWWDFFKEKQYMKVLNDWFPKGD